MFRNSRLQALIILAAGALLGYGAATNGWHFSRQAQAAPTGSQTVNSQVNSAQTPDATPACCKQIADKGALLVHADSPASSGKKPNIIVIMGDDIGMWNIGAYHRGLMAGRTPNLDKLAKEGMIFT